MTQSPRPALVIYDRLLVINGEPDTTVDASPGHRHPDSRAVVASGLHQAFALG